MTLPTAIVAVEAVAILALTVTGLAMGGFSTPLPRPWLLLAHVLGAALLLGNATAGALLLPMADAEGSPRVAAFASRFIMWADAVFMGPAVLLLLATGFALAPGWGGLSATWWLWLGVGLFVAGGAGWLVVLVPLQARLIALSTDELDRPAWTRLARGYAIPGSVVGGAMLVVLALMVLKPA